MENKENLNEVIEIDNVETQIENKDNNKEKRKSNSRFVLTLLIIILLAFFVRNYTFNISLVYGTSMLDTLEDGDIILVNKLLYEFVDPKREDIVIIDKGNNNRYVKRVIGLPGETIELIGGLVLINDEPYKQNFISDESILKTGFLEKIVIPEGHYFVMGDNRGGSKDSRNGLGLIKREEIIGRSDIIIYPFENIKTLK